MIIDKNFHYTTVPSYTVLLEQVQYNIKQYTCQGVIWDNRKRQGLSYKTRKNPALQDSPPAAGRFATDFIPAAVR